MEGRGHQLPHLFGDRNRLFGVRAVFAQQGELVSAHARHGDVFREGIAQALGCLLQQLIAGAMAEAVIDVLEVIEVEQHHRAGRLIRPGARQGVANAVDEQQAVGQAAQGIVERLVKQLAFAALDGA
ncbi:hypothetical protein D9M70_547240 [compost metagenome]